MSFMNVHLLTLHKLKQITLHSLSQTGCKLRWEVLLTHQAIPESDFLSLYTSYSVKFRNMRPLSLLRIGWNVT